MDLFCGGLLDRRRELRHRVQVVLVCAIVNLAMGAFPLTGIAADTPKPVRIVAFGDSLTAGYGLPQSAAFPVQLEKALKAKGLAVRVQNSGVSGDTTGGGLQRLEWAVPEGTQAVILELGANDALRGIDPGKARGNLEKIVAKLTARGIPILLAGMKAPNGFGDDYVDKFDAIFPDLAKANGLILFPFFHDGVALDPKLTLDDGLHPNSKGVAEIVKRILPQVEELIERAKVQAAGVSKG